MRLNLAEIIYKPGESIPFDYELDMSDFDYLGVTLMPKPVRVSGEVRNHAEILELHAHVEAELECVCDRCNREFKKPWSLDCLATLTQDAEAVGDDPDLYELADDEVDVDEIVFTAIVLNMDAKFCCTPDCKGLCMTCGTDLNEGDCGCKPEIDPRLAVLSQLLEEE